MSLLCWNCRGLGNRRAVRRIKKLVMLQDPTLVFLMETRLFSSEMSLLKQRLNFQHGIFVDCTGAGRKRAGGLALLWKDSVSVSLQTYSTHHIDAFILEDSQPVEWRFTGVYGWPEDNNKSQTWALLQSLKLQSSMLWLCSGDFNEIMFSFEKQGGRTRPAELMEAFRYSIEDCRLQDLGFQGCEFTWTNGRGEADNVQERLDRAFASSDFLELYPNIRASHLSRFGSDHNPLLVCLSHNYEDLYRRKKVFRFEGMWLREPSCLETIDDAWRQANQLGNESTISAKLGLCAKQLQAWEKRVFGNINSTIRRLKQQQLTLERLPPTSSNLAMLKNVQSEIDEMLAREEAMWAQRSRELWLREGDKNTNFFHAKASARRRRNTICKIKTENGRLLADADHIAAKFLSYFQKLFGTQGEGALEPVWMHCH